MLVAAAATVGLGFGAAYADGGQGTAANTYFTQLPGVVAQAPVKGLSVATAQGSQAVHAYIANSDRGTWLFAANGNAGANG